MREVGRLRELSFRKAGGGTGEEIDIDSFDISENPYHQLIVWDPKAGEILGGYRYILCSEASTDKNGVVELATSPLFHFSDKFLNEFIPHTIELGRSFVQPAYQSIRRGRKSLYALDNLWDGLGALTVDHPEIKYFFGKVTMYPHFNTEARNLILHFIHQQFPDPDNLITPITPLETNTDISEMNQIFTGSSFKENYRILSQQVRKLGENIPPLINAYMSLSPSMRSFGTAINTHFGDVEETGIIITISDVYEAKKSRHISTYMPFLKIRMPKTKIHLFKKK